MANEQKVKPGYKTTEFWVSIATAITGILITLGVIGQEEANILVKGIEQIVGGILTVVPVAAYAISRGRAKSAVKE